MFTSTDLISERIFRYSRYCFVLHIPTFSSRRDMQKLDEHKRRERKILLLQTNEILLLKKSLRCTSFIVFAGKLILVCPRHNLM